MKLNLKAISLGSLAAVAILAAPLALLKPAEADGGGHQGPSFEKLNLTDAQSAQIEAIRTDAKGQIAAVLTPEQRSAFESSESGRGGLRSLDLTDEQRSQIRAIHDASHKQIDAILTDEQRQELMASRPEGRGHGRGPGLESLNLTETQSAQIEAIHAAAKSQMAALLTAQQQATLENSESPREGLRSLDLTDEQRRQMRAIHDASHEQINAVLTDEQRQQLPERPQGRRGGPDFNQ